MLVVASPTYRRFDALAGCIRSAFSGTVTPDVFLVIDNSGGSAKQHLPRLDEIVYLPMPYNLGVARSWNLAMSMYGNETLIITNDDVTFLPDTIEKMLLCRPADFVYATPPTENNEFSLFMLPYQTWLTVGPFDQRFYPAYFEDNDYFLRLKRANMRIVRSEARYEHIGSATIKSYSVEEMERHHESFRANERYFRQKWGGNDG